MSSGGKRTPLPCLEVHGLVAHPGNIAIAMVLEHAIFSLLQKCQVYPEALVCRFSAGDRLKQEVNWYARVQGRRAGL